MIRRDKGSQQRASIKQEGQQGGPLACSLSAKRIEKSSSVVTDLVSHVWLVVKARWGAEYLIVRVHKLVLVPADVHSIYRSLQEVQTLVARRLQAILCRQVGPQGACQARMVTQVTALKERRRSFSWHLLMMAATF